MAKSSLTGARSTGALRQATYRDVLDAPEHMVAEIIAGVLHTHLRSAPLHAYASLILGAKLENVVGHGGGNGGGGWLHLYCLCWRWNCCSHKLPS